MEMVTRAVSFAMRHDLPAGHVPEYGDFLRRVWSWRDEGGLPCIGSPPWMYMMIVTDPAEVTVVSSLLGTLHPGFEDRFFAVAGVDGSEFWFRDLAALHSFLRACATLGAVNEIACRVCEYVLWSLGFRWV